MLTTILVILLVLALIGGIPAVGLQGPYVYAPGALILIVVLLLLFGAR